MRRFARFKPASARTACCAQTASRAPDLAHDRSALAKGLDGPKEVDGIPIEGTFRAHQVPLATVRENPATSAVLEAWMKSYHPEKLFDADGKLIRSCRTCAPGDNLRMGANPRANGGRVLNALSLPDFVNYASGSSRRRDA